MIVPGDGRNRPPAGSSALMRTSMAWPRARDVVLREAERLAGGDAQLPLHEVEPGDELGHGVLDLQAGVHLEEVELAVLVEELDRAGVDVAAGPGDRDRGRAHRAGGPRRGSPGAGLSSMSFWWRRWDEQSRSPSHSALPWVSASTCISMWRGHVEVALEVDLGAAEGGRAPRAAADSSASAASPGPDDDLHPAPAAAVRGLDRDRPAESLAERDDLVGVRDRLGAPGHRRHAGALGGEARADLVAHHLDRLGGRADEGDARGR